MTELEISAKEASDENKPDMYGLFECSCKKCGKAFFPTPMWIYKDNKGRYCSWTCFNHRNDGKAPRYQAVECLYPNGEKVRAFQSATKAAEWIGGVPYLVKRAIDSGEKYKGYLWRLKG